MPRHAVEAPATSSLLFWGVSLSTVGVFSLGALASLSTRNHAHLAFSSGGLWALVMLEAILAAVWLPILRARGWSLSCTTIPAAPPDLLSALGLVVLCLGIGASTTLAVRILVPEALQSSHEIPAVGHLSFGAILVVSVVNPLAEEFVYLGFINNVLRRRGRGLAVLVSVVARVLVHMDQGVVEILQIAAVGVLFTVYYSRSDRLWAVVFAHGFLDALGLVTIGGHHAGH